ncbi:MAG: ABC transporter ATP-binding protein [Defluviitaleaceae bacterium]|nr:ABC transporter ATP-binding protein [Defluviitaleaceae bacterium]
MIEARNLTKFFSIVNEDNTADGITAVLSASLTVEDGKFVSLLGPSGCGKSTFLEMLGGLQAPTEGAVYIDGVQVLETLPATRKEAIKYARKHWFLSPLANSLFKNKPKHDIAMIFQDYAVFPWMTVLKNVTFALKLRGVARDQRESIALAYLKKVGLDHALTKYPSQLSGGMRQRLALARALAVKPKVILMDEPFAAVDALTRERLQDELVDLIAETDVTIVMVTHDIPEALYLSDEVVVWSANPGTIRNRFTIDVPRPRRRQDAKLLELNDRIEALLKYDITHESEYSI